MDRDNDRDEIVSARLRLVLMDAAFMRAILDGRRDEASRAIGAPIPEIWPEGEDDTWLLNLRLKQIADDPDSAPWLIRAVIRLEDNEMVGHAGFHGKPDVRGMVEVGYTVFPNARRRGYAEETARTLLDWATTRSDVRHLRASVSPSNEPSLALVRKLGFQQIGVQWDERDGEELVFELDPANLA
jgi:[ribosomal protein S5]-alanine N-acetyltransferase